MHKFFFTTEETEVHREVYNLGHFLSVYLYLLRVLCGEKKLIIILLFATLSVNIQAQYKNIPTEPISTDRPDFTESPLVVPKDWTQIETGFTYQKTSEGSAFNAPEALIRYGFEKDWEMRLGGSDFNREKVNGKIKTGFSPLYLAAKYQVGPVKVSDSQVLDISLIPGINVPNGDSNFSSNIIEPEIKFCISSDLNDSTALTLMAYPAWGKEDSKYLLFQQTASLGIQLNDKFGAFFEYAGSFSAHNKEEHLLHTGLTYAIDNDSQIDIHLGDSIQGDSNPFIAGGYSFRF